MTEPRPGGAPGIGPVPLAVVAATGLFVLVLGLWTVVVPQGRAPDEMAHFDLVLLLAEHATYPDADERLMGRAASLSRDGYTVDLGRPWPRYAAADAPPRVARADLIDRGGTAPDPRAGDPQGPPPAPYAYNQMTQHPPLYYAGMAAVLRVERAVLPGSRPPPLDRELGLLRLVNVLLVAPLPLLAWLTTRRLGGSDRAGTVAALLPLGLPQLTHIGAAVNNDNLLTLLAAVLAALLAGVARGRRSVRTDLGVGVVLGLALLTKAFAVALVPWVVAVYAVSWWTAPAQGPARAAVVRGAVRAAAVTVPVGALWWLLNLIRQGALAPSSEDLTRTPDLRPADHDPDPLAFAWTFTGRLLSRTWAWVGFGAPKVELGGLAVVVLVVVTAGALAGTAASAARGRGPSSGPRRVDVALALVPLVAVVAFVAGRAWTLHRTTGGHAFIQGRYLFCAIVPVMALVGVGTARILGRRAVPVALATAIALQGWTLVRVVDTCWSGGAFRDRIGALLAWSPWPSPVVVAVAGATIAAVALTVWAVAAPEAEPGEAA